MNNAIDKQNTVMLTMLCLYGEEVGQVSENEMRSYIFIPDELQLYCKNLLIGNSRNDTSF